MAHWSGGLFALVGDDADHGLIKVDTRGQVVWREPVTGHRLRVASSSTGGVLLLADRETDRTVVRSGETGKIVGFIPRMNTEVSSDGRQILAVPDMSTTAHLCDDSAHLLWSHTGRSDASAELAPLSGDVLFWNLDQNGLIWVAESETIHRYTVTPQAVPNPPEESKSPG